MNPNKARYFRKRRDILLRILLEKTLNARWRADGGWKKREEFRRSKAIRVCRLRHASIQTNKDRGGARREWIAGGGRGGWCRFRTCKRGEARAIVRRDWNHANLYLTANLPGFRERGYIHRAKMPSLSSSKLCRLVLRFRPSS